jgi:ankyrin repeat protein
VNPPADYDADMAIDDDSHTALHRASVMGGIRVVGLMLTAGADIVKVNTMIFSTENVSANKSFSFIGFLLIFAIAASWYVWTKGVPIFSLTLLALGRDG